MLCTFLLSRCVYIHLVSSSKFNLPLIGSFDVTHAARALQSHDLSGEGIKLWITFLTTQGHGGPPGMSDQLDAGAISETAQTWKTIHTKHTLSHPNKANMNDDYDGQMIFVDRGGLKFPDICLTGEEKPRKIKTSLGKPVPTGDRTCCGTSAHATTGSIAVDPLINKKLKLPNKN